MALKQFKEIIGLAMIGEGIMGMIYPRKYSLLWKIGPESLQELMETIAENPETARLIYAAEAGIGFWLATGAVKSLSD